MAEKMADKFAEDMMAKSKVTSWSSDSWTDGSGNLVRRIKTCRGEPLVCKTEQTVIKKGEEVLAKDAEHPKTKGFVPALNTMVKEIQQMRKQLPYKSFSHAMSALFSQFVGCPLFPTEDASPFPGMP